MKMNRRSKNRRLGVMNNDEKRALLNRVGEKDKQRLIHNKEFSRGLNYEIYPNNISSDFVFFFKALGLLIAFILMFIPSLLNDIFSRNKIFKKNLSRISKIFIELKNWFFQAKQTAFLIIFIIVCFIGQIFIAIFKPEWIPYIMSNPENMTNIGAIGMITSIFLHADLMHIGYNLLALLIFGRVVEKHFGTKTIFLFLMGGFLANLISNLINLYSGNIFPSIGASGGISTLALIAIIISPFKLVSVTLPIPIFIVGWFQILTDLISQIRRVESRTNFLAHICGYIAVIILFFFFEKKHKSKFLKGVILNIVFLILTYFILRYFSFDFGRLLN